MLKCVAHLGTHTHICQPHPDRPTDRRTARLELRSHTANGSGGFTLPSPQGAGQTRRGNLLMPISRPSVGSDICWDNTRVATDRCGLSRAISFKMAMQHRALRERSVSYVLYPHLTIVLFRLADVWTPRNLLRQISFFVL